MLKNEVVVGIALLRHAGNTGHWLTDQKT